MTNKIKVCSLFSGIGGFEFGLYDALGKEKVEVVFSSEIDKYASLSYSLLHGHVPCGDITKIHEDDIPHHDLLVGGFPCQAFSIAGKRKGFDDTRGTLFFEVARILKAKMPKYFILENVKGLLSHDKGNTFETIKNTLDSLGYTYYFKVLNSKFYNVPQNRERIFIVGSRDENFTYEFPEEKVVSKCLRDVLEDVVDEKYYLSKERMKNFVPKKSNTDIKIEGRTSHHQHGIVYGTDGIIGTLMACDYKDPKHIMVEGNLNCEGWMDYECRVYSDKGISPTVTSQGSKPKIKENSFIRKLTPLECFRLQSFPDDAFHLLKEHGLSNTQLYKMAGNAVTSNVISAIVKNLFKGVI